MADLRPKTIFCDIDGTLVEHPKTPSEIASGEHTSLKVLPGVIKQLTDWDAKGYTIILITGRKESLRSQTEKQLDAAGIFYDRLIMGIGGGPRVLINDYKPNNTTAPATAICVSRDVGLENINL